MNDLNDFVYFAAVVTHKGFASAARALQVPKSSLSRRIARLEESLAVRLLERSTRRFRVTDIGQEFYLHCEAIIASKDAAEAVAARVRSTPAGLVRVSCPPGMSPNIMAAILPAFLAAHPRVRVQLISTNRRIDLIEERVDIAVRVRSKLDTDAALTMRVLGHARSGLVASPALLRSHGVPMQPADLASMPTLGMHEDLGADTWHLTGPDGVKQSIRHVPRLGSSDMEILLEAALAGLGVTLLPDMLTNGPLQAGGLVRVLPQWYTAEGIVHLVFTTRRGLLPAVRALIDHLVDALPKAMAACHEVRAANGAPANGAWQSTLKLSREADQKQDQ